MFEKVVYMGFPVISNIGGWGSESARMPQTGNSFGSCACAIPRLGFFYQNVLQGGAHPTLVGVVPIVMGCK